ncbi:hypothetical protein FOL47_006825 [Perkinsus chesapeaki]|uniref:Uncharacterized protein n=1 Tax=Perkinsus chesapeaki TaxID=330153 RepID=A0A7J6MWQ3_PERCH|nr:hypothetical protein FOL47_006825 [Perkinsus chesapeaki]
MLVAESTNAAPKESAAAAAPPRSGSISLVTGGGKTPRSSQGAAFRPIPATTPVPFPSHIQIEGASGPYGDEINGYYILQPTARGILGKWKFCYFKNKCENVVLCYGEDVPELGETGAGLVGWAVAKIDPEDHHSGSVEVLARCVVKKEDNGQAFKWFIKSISASFVPIYTINAKPVVATPAAAAAVVCAQTEPEGVKSSRRTRDRADSAAAHQRIAFAGMLANAQAQLLAAKCGDGLLPAPMVVGADEPATMVDEFDVNGIPELTRSITAPANKGRRVSFAPAASEKPPPPAASSSTTSSRRLSALAPVFIPRRHTVAGQTLFTPPTTATKYTNATKKMYKRSNSTIDDLFRSAERHQGVYVNSRAGKVTWNLGTVADKLKCVVPGEAVSSITFRLPRETGDLGPPIQFEFYPFGVKGKSPPGCAAVGLNCPQGACMRFLLSLGKATSGAKVLMGNRFYVDFYPPKAGGADGGEGDSGIVQAFKYSDLRVSLQLLEWMDGAY